MRLTTKGRYAVTALLDLAYQGDDAIVPLSEISERQSISVSYLEQLFSKMRKRGLVSSVRGASGGYRLAKPADAISVHEIIDAVDETIKATRCGGKGDCQNGEMCLTHDLWSDLSQKIEQYLVTVKLASLLNKKEVQTVALRQSCREKQAQAATIQL